MTEVMTEVETRPQMADAEFDIETLLHDLDGMVAAAAQSMNDESSALALRSISW